MERFEVRRLRFRFPSVEILVTSVNILVTSVQILPNTPLIYVYGGSTSKLFFFILKFPGLRDCAGGGNLRLAPTRLFTSLPMSTNSIGPGTFSFSYLILIINHVYLYLLLLLTLYIYIFLSY
jgi:hypothetical protein